MRLDPATEDLPGRNVQVRIHDHTYLTIVGFNTNKVFIAYPDQVEYPMDTTQQFHTYRVEGKGDMFRVYVDGTLAIDYHRSWSGGGTQSLSFGDCNGSGYSRSYWDYFMYDTNVSAPLNDHFLCYKASVKSGTPKFQEVDVDLTDQFGIFLDVTVEKPKSLGTPTDKNGEGILDAESHLNCYEVKPATGTPKLPKGLVVETNDQFGHLTLKLGSKPETLCVPSLKTLIVPGEPCGPVVCGPGTECCNPLLGICVEPGQGCLL